MQKETHLKIQGIVQIEAYPGSNRIIDQVCLLKNADWNQSLTIPSEHTVFGKEELTIFLPS